MRNLIIYIILLFTVLFSQTVTWETQIPFESESDGPVGIDVDSIGNIYIACFSNGPNESIWTADTLIHSPETKVITLDSGGNIIENRNYGVLFNNEVQGIGLTDTDYKLIGTSESAYYHDVVGYYYMRSVWIINNSEGEMIDTLTYNCDNKFEYTISLTKSSQNHEPISIISHNDTYAGGGSTNYLFDMEGKCLYQPDSIAYPDSLIYKNKAYRNFAYEYICDFDLTGNDVITCGAFQDNLFEGYAYLMKTNDFNTLWEIYEKVEQFGYGSVIFYKVAADTDNDIIVNVWIDQNGNNNQDENEYFIKKYSSDGTVVFTSSSFIDKFEWLYNIGENQFIAKEYGNDTVFKFTDTGTGINIDWEYVLDNAHIIRPLQNSFITAGIEDTNIIVRKIDATTGIDFSNILPVNTSLFQNYPNPFNPTTNISFYLSKNDKVELKLYNVAGQLVKNIIEKELKAGNHSVLLEANDLNNGVYYYTLKTEDKKISRKMLLLK